MKCGFVSAFQICRFCLLPNIECFQTWFECFSNPAPLFSSFLKELQMTQILGLTGPWTSIHYIYILFSQISPAHSVFKFTILQVGLMVPSLKGCLSRDRVSVEAQTPCESLVLPQSGEVGIYLTVRHRNPGSITLLLWHQLGLEDIVPMSTWSPHLGSPSQPLLTCVGCHHSFFCGVWIGNRTIII